MFYRFIHNRRPYILLPIIIFFAVGSALAQTLSGHVYDEHHNPIPGAQIYIPTLGRGAVTNTKGHFEIDNLPNGVYAVQFSFVGYLSQVKNINTAETQDSMRIVLRQSTLNLPGLTVTGTPQATDALSSSQSIVSVDQKQFQRNSGATAMSAIRNLPGVSLVTTGSGIAKPVIHGLSSQRIVVMVNGVRQEAQNWGPDHGPEISTFNVNRIEVVKGPSSVLYGAGALGGVVNVIGPGLPTSDNGTHKLGGNLYLQGFSNNNQGAGAISLHGASGSFGYRAQFSHRAAGDISTPDGKLSNSGLRKTNGSFMIGTTQSWGSVSLDYNHLYQHLQIHDAPGSTGFQPLKNDLLHVHANIPTKDFRLEVQAGYQMNDRREFDAATDNQPSLHLKLNTGTVDVQMHHNPIGPLYGTMGFSTMIQTNRSLAANKLIPGYNLQNFAGFLYEQAKFGPLNLSAGGRFDTRNLDVSDTPAMNIRAVNRKYSAFSGSVGAAVHLTADLSLSANLGHAWRAPTAFEMFANGVHEGTYQYDIGSPDLVPETATNIQGSLKWITSKVVAEVSAYNNGINKYIYGDPTGKFDPKSGYQIYDLKQANARIRGIDASLQAEVTDWLSLNGGYSMLRGDNLKLHVPLPYMPANHGDIGLRIQKRELGIFHDPYLSIQTSFYAKQDRVAPNEPDSKAYTLANVSLGSQLNVGKTPVQCDIIVDNLFNKAYIDHLSRYRDLPALNPGRNIVLKVQIPFTLVR
ncbi:MAG TPA: TonB-dependent receptor [Balneolales bacterium]|nr:TonB-dependent receptor [Balneolales bacterium]